MKKILLSLGVLMIALVATAEPKLFNLSITPGIAVYGEQEKIEGVTLSIWGQNEQKSLALGIVNGSTGPSAGLDCAMILNYTDNYTGVKFAMVNYTNQNAWGWDSGFVNYSKGLFCGLATGAVNYASRLNGVEFGFINYADQTDSGLQLGLINIIDSNKTWFEDSKRLAPVMIFFNWGF